MPTPNLTISDVDRFLVQLLGLSSADMPDICWWAILEGASDAREATADAIAQWCLDGDLSDDEADGLLEELETIR